MKIKGIGFWMILGLMGLSWSAFSPGKGLKGVLHADSALFDKVEEATHCRIDSGAGQVLYIHQEHENPLFPSKAENRVHLMLYFPEGMQAGKTYTLPTSAVQVCYFEQGDLLMFKSFSGKGTLVVDKVEEGKGASGSMDLKLVNPHHNMSNSDYHYMGGPFKLKWQGKN